MSTIGNWLNGLRSELAHLSPKIDPILTLLEVAQAASGVGGPGAATALKVLQAAFDAFASQQAGTMTSEQLTAQLAALKAEIGTAIPQIEADQDAALGAKFPAGPPPSTQGA